MVLPGLQGSYKRTVHRNEDVDEGGEYRGNGKYLFAC